MASQGVLLGGVWDCIQILKKGNPLLLEGLHPSPFAIVGDATENGKPVKKKLKDNFSGTDYGFLVGLGYIHRTGIGVGYRYNLGLANISKSTDESASISINTVGHISVMYYFKWSDGGRGHRRGHRRR